MRGEISGRLPDALPPLLTLTADVWECPLTPLLMAEIVRDEPGQEVVLDRLPDLLVIAAAPRAWFARPEGEAPGWYRALADPVVGRVPRLLQDDPTHPWTVAALAAKADAPRDTDDTLETIARRVGYGSAFALSSAFKRVYGVRPQEHRAG